jgi:hypothetical protein
MNLEKHISELLYRYQCVAVPGFGAFLTEIVSAQLIENSNSFYPPKKRISFNANLKNNDGLLANQIAVTDKVSYEYAVSKINLEVEEWFDLLEKNKNLPLKNIGTFAYNKEQNLVFSPVDNFNYLATSFGLTQVVSPKVKRDVFEPILIEPDFDNVISNEEKIEVGKIEEKEIIRLENRKRIEEEFDTVKKQPKRNSNLKYAAVFLIGCGIASPYFLNLYKEKIAIDNLVVEAKVQKQVQSKIQEATFLISNPLKDVSLLANSVVSLNYHVVAGAYKVEENADRNCKNLIAKGFQAQKLSQNANGLYPVVYNSYATYTEASNAMDAIKKHNNPDAWVLIQQLDKK